MAALNLVLTRLLELQHLELRSAPVSHAFAVDLGFCGGGSPDDFLVVSADSDDVVKRHLPADFPLEPLDLNRQARLDSILLSPLRITAYMLPPKASDKLSLYGFAAARVNELCRLTH